jgi:hypothetical protein
MMLSMSKPLFMLILPACLMAANSSAVDEVDDDAGDSSIRCINTRSLKTTEVVNDSNLLFYMTGKKVYLNVMPRECKGLSRERRFSYSTNGRSLCSSDAIRILTDSGGSLHQGKLCRLGRFYLTSKEEIAAARERGSEPPRAKPPAGAEVEEIGTEADEAED